MISAICFYMEEQSPVLVKDHDFWPEKRESFGYIDLYERVVTRSTEEKGWLLVRYYSYSRKGFKKTLYRRKFPVGFMRNGWLHPGNTPYSRHPKKSKLVRHIINRKFFIISSRKESKLARHMINRKLFINQPHIESELDRYFINRKLI